MPMDVAVKLSILRAFFGTEAVTTALGKGCRNVVLGYIAAAFRWSIQRLLSFRTTEMERCGRISASSSRAPLWWAAHWLIFPDGCLTCQLRKNRHGFDFPKADALFRQDRLNDLIADVERRRYLKLRSLNRTEYLERLFQAAGIPRPDVGAGRLFDAAFNAGMERLYCQNLLL